MPLFTTTPISTRMPITAMMFISVPVSQNSQYTPKIENTTQDMIAPGNSSDSNTAAMITNIRIRAMAILVTIWSMPSKLMLKPAPEKV